MLARLLVGVCEHMCVRVQVQPPLLVCCTNQGELVGVFTLWSCFIHVNEDVLGFPSLQGHTHCRSTLGINYPLHPCCICSECDHGHLQIRLTSSHSMFRQIGTYRYIFKVHQSFSQINSNALLYPPLLHLKIMHTKKISCFGIFIWYSWLHMIKLHSATCT